MVSRRSIAVLLPWLALLLSPPAHAAEKTPADLVLVQQGALPIILAAPHGGLEEDARVDVREQQDPERVGARRPSRQRHLDVSQACGDRTRPARP